MATFGLGLVPVAGAKPHGAAATAATSARTPPLIAVTAGRPSENKFRLSRTSVERGTVIFRITNLGRRAHGFGINGHISSRLRPHASTTLTVVFKKAGRYIYSDTCLESVNSAEMQEAAPAPTPCASGLLTVS